MSETGAAGKQAGARALRTRLFEWKPGEGAALFWAFASFFFVLASYYVLRALRDAMGLEGGAGDLPWLFTATLALVFVLNPLFSRLTAALPRARLVPWCYRFAGLNLLAFVAAFRLLPDEAMVWVARAFFPWTTVFVSFAVAIAWALFADSFSSEQGRRLFGLVSAGGTAGALAGSLLTSHLATTLGVAGLLLVALALLEAAVFATRRLARVAGLGDAAPGEEISAHDEETLPAESFAPIRRAWEGLPAGARRFGAPYLRGMLLVLGSPYLLAICFYLFLYTLSSTFLYFAQGQIVEAGIEGRAERTAFFASINTWVNAITLVIQLFLTGRVLRLLGVGLTMTLLPAISLGGLAAVAASPALATIFAVQVLRRSANFAVGKPARELLYTVVSREEKYRSKTFIDTFVYRGGDAVAGWAFSGMTALGFGLGAIALTSAPLAALWAGLGLFLGLRFTRRERESAPPLAKAPLLREARVAAATAAPASGALAGDSAPVNRSGPRASS